MPKPDRDAALAAFKTLIAYIGEDPAREGLRDTPARALAAWEHWTRGYAEEPEDILRRTFSEVEGYDEMVALTHIRVASHCEHHLAPIIGVAHVGYIPNRRVVGISKLARTVDAFAARLQIQEKLTAQIARAISEILQPLGVGVMIEAEHHCMTTRGVDAPGARMVTSYMLGEFRENPRTRAEFLDIIRQGGAAAR